MWEMRLYQDFLRCYTYSNLTSTTRLCHAVEDSVPRYSRLQRALVILPPLQGINPVVIDGLQAAVRANPVEEKIGPTQKMRILGSDCKANGKFRVFPGYGLHAVGRKVSQLCYDRTGVIKDKVGLAAQDSVDKHRTAALVRFDLRLFQEFLCVSLARAAQQYGTLTSGWSISARDLYLAPFFAKNAAYTS